MSDKKNKIKKAAKAVALHENISTSIEILKNIQPIRVKVEYPGRTLMDSSHHLFLPEEISCELKEVLLKFMESKLEQLGKVIEQPIE